MEERDYFTQGEINNLLTDLIDAAYTTGYYAAVFEKCANLSDTQLKEYQSHQREEIARRVEIRGKLLALLFPTH